jgi:hypothetical protein
MIKQFVIAMLISLPCGLSHAISFEPVSRNDSDADGIVDTVDIDDDNDGVPDVWELSSDGADIDSDKDGMPDRLDLDSDNDSLLDWQESGAARVADFSSLTVIGGRLNGDVGNNGMLNVFDIFVDSRQLVYVLLNSDAPLDNVPDIKDLDSDNDGLPDLREAGVIQIMDNDGDARIDAPPGSVGRDGIPDQIQNINDESCCDLNADGADDITPRNTDGIDFPDFQDIDSDNDGVFDLVEAGGSDLDENGVVDAFADTDNDGMDDSLIPIPLAFVDNNGNGADAEIDEAEQPAVVEEPADTPSDVLSDPAQSDDYQPIRDPASRPGTIGAPLDDGVSQGFVATSVNGSGCSITSRSSDVLLSLLAIASMSVLGWRFTLRRLAKRDRS